MNQETHLFFIHVTEQFYDISNIFVLFWKYDTAAI